MNSPFNYIDPFGTEGFWKGVGDFFEGVGGKVHKLFGNGDDMHISRANKITVGISAPVTVIAGSVAALAGGGAAAIGTGVRTAGAGIARAWGWLAGSGGAIVQLGQKLDYFFGKATGNEHNIERSQSMLRQLERIGLPDTAASRQFLAEHLGKVAGDASNVLCRQENGRVIKESLLMGPNGSAKLETVWEGTKLITGKFLGGK